MNAKQSKYRSREVSSGNILQGLDGGLGWTLVFDKNFPCRTIGGSVCSSSSVVY